MNTPTASLAVSRCAVLHDAAMNRPAYLIFSVIASVFSSVSPLQWDANSLLQPGPCPSVGHSHMPTNIQLLAGLWNIAQLPRDFAKCCSHPTIELLTDTPSPNQESSNIFITYLPSGWLRVKVDFLPCFKNQTTFHSFATRLYQNMLSKEAFLIELPWPLNLAGFSTLNILETDYKTYLTGYICHSLLLEHLGVPFVMTRALSSIDQAHLLRLKWSLIKTGIPSAWSLSDVTGEECNELFTSGGKRKNDTVVNNNRGGVANGTEVLANGPSTHNPDSDVEWITSEYDVEIDEDDDAIHFPGEEELTHKKSSGSDEEPSSVIEKHPTPIQ